MKISGAAKLQQRSPALYNNLLGAHYEKEICDSITIDLPRTFPDNIHFDTKKERLFNILVAYAHHNREVGYCQGLNYIAGMANERKFVKKKTGNNVYCGCTEP